MGRAGGCENSEGWHLGARAGMELFHAVNAAFSNPQIVAEDLGCEEEGWCNFFWRPVIPA